jgi:hypothetical protein
MVEVAKRLCSDSNIPVAEVHTYHWIGDEMRFLPVYKAPTPAGRATSTSAARASGKQTSAKAKAVKPSAKKKPAAKAAHAKKKPGKSAKRK